MQLNKVDRLRFIVNGSQKLIKILFKEKLFNIVPVYYSSDVDELLLLKFDDNSLVIIANEDYVNNSEITNINIEILSNILSQEYNNILVDLHLANWLGYSNVIKFLHSYGEIERINKLEEAVGSNINSLIKDKDYILNKFKYVVVD